MEIPGKVSVYCPLIDAKGTAAMLLAITPQGYYHLEMEIRGRQHAMFVPIANTAMYFAEPEPEIEEGLEIER